VLNRLVFTGSRPVEDCFDDEKRPGPRSAGVRRSHSRDRDRAIERIAPELSNAGLCGDHALASAETGPMVTDSPRAVAPGGSDADSPTIASEYAYS